MATRLVSSTLQYLRHIVDHEPQHMISGDNTGVYDFLRPRRAAQQFSFCQPGSVEATALLYDRESLPDVDHTLTRFRIHGSQVRADVTFRTLIPDKERHTHRPIVRLCHVLLLRY